MSSTDSRVRHLVVKENQVITQRWRRTKSSHKGEGEPSHHSKVKENQVITQTWRRTKSSLKHEGEPSHHTNMKENQVITQRWRRTKSSHTDQRLQGTAGSLDHVIYWQQRVQTQWLKMTETSYRKPRLGFSKMFLIMTTDVRLINSRRCQLVETHHTDSWEEQDVHYSLCTLPTDTIYHLVETHHTDRREDQDVHYSLHMLPIDTMYHLAETHHTDSREDQDVHYSLHMLPIDNVSSGGNTPHRQQRRSGCAPWSPYTAHCGTMSFTDSGMQSTLVR